MLFQKWWFIRGVLKYGSPIISLFEKRGVSRYGGFEPDQPCVFIIGPPRSGSTIVYQIITSLLDVSYVDNLANLARYNPWCGMRLSHQFYSGQSHTSYTSVYGQTTQGGLHAPAEALFFYKWFPRDRHYTEPSDLSTAQKEIFRKTLYSLINLAKKPLIIKNLSFSLRLQLLREVAPGSRYIVVRRDPLFTAQSILLGMRKHKHPENRVWGILPKDFKKLEGMEPHEMVVNQVNLIERQIHHDLKNISEENILYIDYEKLGSHLEWMLGEVMTLCGPGINKRGEIELPGLRVENRITLPQDEIGILKHHIQSMDWELHNK